MYIYIYIYIAFKIFISTNSFCHFNFTAQDGRATPTPRMIGGGNELKRVWKEVVVA